MCRSTDKHILTAMQEKKITGAKDKMESSITVSKMMQIITICSGTDNRLVENLNRFLILLLKARYKQRKILKVNIHLGLLVRGC